VAEVGGAGFDEGTGDLSEYQSKNAIVEPNHRTSSLPAGPWSPLLVLAEGASDALGVPVRAFAAPTRKTVAARMSLQYLLTQQAVAL
jgi:hypothetical protein